MVRKNKTNEKGEEIDFVDKLIECSNDNCLVWTKTVVPSDYDTSMWILINHLLFRTHILMQLR